MIPASLASAPMAYLTPVALLFCSNLFMTLAWYGHLKFKSVALGTVILVSGASPLWNIVSRCRQTGSAARSIPPPS